MNDRRLKPFKDLFSGHATDYSLYRPTYPASLYQFLATSCDETLLAWDCATGNGQAACSLASWFKRVIATDASEEQIKSASVCSKVHYHVARAEKSELTDSSVDLITVAQAFHWFDQKAFSEEAKRVLKPRGLLALWTYNLLHIEPDIDGFIQTFYQSLKNDWAFERTQVEQGYCDVTLPMQVMNTPDFDMEVAWSLDQVMNYLGTWSALKSYIEKHQSNPLEQLYHNLAECWGDPSQKKTVIWPLSVKLWRNV